MTGKAGPSRPRLGLGRRPGLVVTLAVLITLLSVIIALASYQGAKAASGQREGEAGARGALAEANAAYAEAGRGIIRDYAAYDSWYLQGTGPEVAGGYPADFSPALVAALGRSPADPFDEAYYEETYAGAQARFADADRLFAEARQHNERANHLQLVVVIGAVGLAVAAWASLLGVRSRLRPALALLATAALAAGTALYFAVPAAPG